MNVFTMVFGIVVVTSLAAVIQSYFKSKTMSGASSELLDRIGALETLVTQKLEKRISNLETIVTDPEFDLKQKFKNL